MVEILLYLVVLNLLLVVGILAARGRARKAHTLLLAGTLLLSIWLIQTGRTTGPLALLPLWLFCLFLLLPVLFSWLLRWAGRFQLYRLAAFLSRATDLLLLRPPQGSADTYRALARIQAGKGEEVIREFRERLARAEGMEEKALLARQLLPLLAKAERFEEVVDLFQAPWPWSPRPWEPMGALLARSLAELGRFGEMVQVVETLEEGPAAEDLQARGWLDLARLVFFAALGEADLLEELLAPSSSFGEELPRPLVRKWLEKARVWQAEPPLSREALPPGLYERVLAQARQSAAMPRSLGLGPGIAPVTSILCLGILAFYFWSESLGGATNPWVLVRLGALFSWPDLLQNPWKLLSTMFLHFGPVHMGVNLLALWLFGRLAEQAFGSVRYVLVYLVSGLAGGILSLAFGDPGIRVGASGAILGVIGAATLLFASNRPGRPWPPAWRKQVFFGLFLTLAGTVAFGAFFKEVDNMAHMGGALAGILLAALLKGKAGRPGRPGSAARRGKLLFHGAATLLLLSLPLLASRYDPFRSPWPREAALGVSMETPPWWGEFPPEGTGRNGTGGQDKLLLGLPGTCVFRLWWEPSAPIHLQLPPRGKDSPLPPPWKGGRVKLSGSRQGEEALAFARKIGGRILRGEFLVREEFASREIRALARLLASLRPGK